MNIFKTQPVRNKYHLTMEEEYVLGMIGMLEPMSTTRILGMAEKQEVLSPSTTHKYLTNLHRKKLLCRARDIHDSRALQFTLSDKGKQVLEDLKHAYVRG